MAPRISMWISRRITQGSFRSSPDTGKGILNPPEKQERKKYCADGESSRFAGIVAGDRFNVVALNLDVAALLIFALHGAIGYRIGE